MGKNYKFPLFVVAMLVLSIFLSACNAKTGGGSSSKGDSNGGDSDVIKIGVMAPTTGQSAAEGKDMVNGAELAAKHINDEGGIDGKKIKLVIQDDACDPQQAVTAANKLIQEKVSMVVGTYCSSAALPASGTFNKAGMPVILVGANSPQLPQQGYKNLFLINSMVLDQGKEVSEYFKKKDIKKIALVHDNSDYARDLADITKELHEKNGGKVVAFEAINPEEKDFGALATKLKTLNPDATYFTGFYNSGGLLVKQFKQKGVSGLFVAGDGNPVEPFMDIAGKENAEGVVFSQTVTLEYVDTPEAKAFLEEYKNTYKSNPLMYGHRQYDGVRLAADVIKRAKSATDHKAIIQAIKDTKDFPAFGETYSFQEDGTKENGKYILIKIKDGSIVIEDK
ncbi:branched-chain amino acid ABC transporter substrate-binding protein [Neobacillus sp. NPDC097160]|uniref:branched-chain amino acid ABC transporter substrate-binding protein n=1 Tax=Neobacillus sp. NPDC097160 TaxID=3364298 RepID=UPI0037F3783B